MCLIKLYTMLLAFIIFTTNKQLWVATFLVKTVKNASLIIIRTKVKNPIRSYAKYTHSMSKVLALIVNNILYAEY